MGRGEVAESKGPGLRAPGGSALLLSRSAEEDPEAGRAAVNGVH